ncbi:MAG TPA: glycoside hydrolase domain-containing protein [Segeticoccus sp.]|nr:glycoside hydrolase domain-containing protein [Segeticoccus sp.]
MRKFHALLLVAGLLIAAAAAGTRPAPEQLQLTAGSQVRGDAKGADRCQAPSHTQMAAWWSGTPFWWWGVYIGGSMMLCANTNVTASWINTEVNRGWRLLPIWVGPQAPCTGYADRFPSNTGDAYNKGYNVAHNAYNHASNDLNMDMYKLPIAYDLEPFDTTNSGCLAAAKAFIRGWDAYLNIAPAQKPGLYGSVGGSGLDDFWSIDPNPYFIWGARYDGDSHTSDFGGYIGSSHWSNTRHKQYQKNVTRTYNSVKMTVDLDCAHGPLYGLADTYVDSACS